eukprot:TRINITY_DN108356_c0_g1_i1.p1 TRINITY_DN108356_c0_g1~~TRINITY_DN108356_c0_g1_i1.p1  ORF type:complete len:2406 (-),score=479.44 TRINITY_DN108356_c0_g1_i1:8-6664(-)
MGSIPIHWAGACNEVPKPLRLAPGGEIVANESRCVQLRLPQDLKSGEAYMLNLRSGARYHPFAGPYGGEQTDGIKLTGIRPFRFDFLPRRECSRPHFRLLCRHGLQAPTDQSLAVLSKFITLTDTATRQELPLHLNMTNPATLEITVDNMQPQQEYSLRVKPPWRGSGEATVYDGLGLPLQESEVTLSMKPLPGVFLLPQPHSASMWSASSADRFLPDDAPSTFPVLQRESPVSYGGATTGKDAATQAFICQISSMDDLSSYITFLFSPEKADPAKLGPCARQHVKEGTFLLTGSSKLWRSDVALDMSASRLAFLEIACIPKGGSWTEKTDCGPQRPPSRARFINAPSFHILTAVVGTRSTPFADPDARSGGLLIVSAHDIASSVPRSSLKVDVWEIPEWLWQGGHSVQPEARKIVSGVTDAHGISRLAIPKANHAAEDLSNLKGYVVTASDPDSGEILVGDLLRMQEDTSMKAGDALSAALRVSMSTDRGVYAPGDAIGIIGLVSAVGTYCPGNRPGNACAPADIESSAANQALIAAEIVWRFDRGPEHPEICTVHLWPVSGLGVFTANVTVPSNASFGRVPSFTLSWIGAESVLVPPDCQSWRRVRAEAKCPTIDGSPDQLFDVLVADPRPPSALLKLMDWPEFTLPHKELKLSIQLETYTGLPLQGHEVTLEVKLDRSQKWIANFPQPQRPDKDTSKSTEIIGITDERGLWKKELDFTIGGELDWKLRVEDKLTLKVTSRGPTGEILAQSRTIPVHLGPHEVQIRTSMDIDNAKGPLPGQNFAAFIGLKERHSTSGWEVSPSKEAVRAVLVHVPDERVQKEGNRCMGWMASQIDGAVDVSVFKAMDVVEMKVCRQPFTLDFPAVCTWRLPSAGHYVIIAEVDMRFAGGEERKQVGCMLLGRSEKSWRHSPLGTPAPFSRFLVRQTEPSYSIGDDVSLEVWNPLSLPARLLTIWGEKHSVIELQDVQPDAFSTVRLGTLTEEDCPMPACQVHFFIFSSKATTQSFTKDVPTSLLYPKGSPLFAHHEFVLHIERPHRRLEVHVQPNVDHTLPGSEVELQVNLGSELEGLGTGFQAEVALMVMDKSWLDLRPQKLLDPVKALELSESVAKGPELRMASSLSGIASAYAMDKAAALIQKRFVKNPWIGYMDWKLSLRSEDSTDLDDPDYLDRYAQEITAFPPADSIEPFPFPMFKAESAMMASPMAMVARSAPMADEAEDAMHMDLAAASPEAVTKRSSPAADGGVSLRKRFAKLVALEHRLLAPGERSWKLRVRLPQDLSTYVIRAVAVSKQADGTWKWGSGQGSVVTDQQVYGKPLMPRMVRFTDVCRIGVMVQAAKIPTSIRVSAEDAKNLRLLDEAEHPITMSSTSAEVRFTFAADMALGPASVIFKVKDAMGTLLDQVEAHVDVEAQQQAIRIATTSSIIADGSQSVERRERISPMRVVPGSGELMLSASAGFQGPLLQALLEVAPQTESVHWRPRGEEVLALLLGGLVLRAGYGLEATYLGLNAAVEKAAARLRGHVTGKPDLLGFVSTPPEERRAVPLRGERLHPDLSANSLALLVLRAAAALGGAPSEWAPLDRSMLQQAAYQAVSFERQQWDKCCREDLSLATYIGEHRLAFLFLADPEARNEPELRGLWEDTMRAGVTAPQGSELDLLARLASALELGTGLVWNLGSDRQAEESAAKLLQRTRVQGPTAYIAQAEGSMHSSSAWTQSLALWLWASIDGYARHPFAALLSSQLLVAERSPWQACLPARHLILASLALLAFDTATGSAKSADLPLKAVALPSKFTLLEAHLQSSGPERKLDVQTAWPWDELPSTVSEIGMELVMQVEPGSGMAVTSIAMNFIPRRPYLEPQFRGILVQKVVQHMDPSKPGSCKGPPLHLAVPGDVLCVTIQVTSPDDLREAEVIDLVPGGLEPLDDALPGAALAAGETPGSTLLPLGDRSVTSDSFSLHLAALPPPLQSREVRHDSVRWRAGYLWAGTHSFTYAAVANVPGAYALPAAKAFSAENPEVMGLSGSAAFIVRETGDSASAVSAPQLLEFRDNILQVGPRGYVGAERAAADLVSRPKPCPEACPRAGSCNLATGVCDCASPSGELLPCEEVTTKLGAPRVPAATELEVGDEQSRPEKLAQLVKKLAALNSSSVGHRGREEEGDGGHLGTPIAILICLAAILAFFGYPLLAKTTKPKNFTRAEEDDEGAFLEMGTVAAANADAPE